MMKAQAIVRLNFISKKQLNVVLQALKPEILISSTNRSKVNMSTENQTLNLEFIALDTSALRASMNSYLRLIGVAINLKKLTNQ